MSEKIDERSKDLIRILRIEVGDIKKRLYKIEERQQSLINAIQGIRGCITSEFEEDS